MAHPGDILFTLNTYDRDGDLTEEGVFLHFGDTRVKAADTVEGFRSIVTHMQMILREVEEMANT